MLTLFAHKQIEGPYVRVLPDLLGEGVEHRQPQQVQEPVQIVLQERRGVRGQGGVEALQQGSDGLLGRQRVRGPCEVEHVLLQLLAHLRERRREGMEEGEKLIGLVVDGNSYVTAIS